MGTLGLSVLLLAVDCIDVSLDVDCVSSLDVESSSGSELVNFCEVLVGSLDSLDTRKLGLYSDINFPASSCTAG